MKRIKTEADFKIQNDKKASRDKVENFIRSYHGPFDAALVAERCGISDWSARRNLRIFTKFGLVRQIPQNGRRHTFVRLTGADVEKTVRRNKMEKARKWLEENVRPTDFGLAFCCLCAGCKMLAAVGGLA